MDYNNDLYDTNRQDFVKNSEGNRNYLQKKLGEGDFVKFNLNYCLSPENSSYLDLLNLITHRNEKIKCFEALDNEGYMNENYVISQEGEILINPQHFRPILEKLSETRLFDELVSNLNNIHIPNPQRSNVYQEESYCNEEVYGNFKFVIVYGFLKF